VRRRYSLAVRVAVAALAFAAAAPAAAAQPPLTLNVTLPPAGSRASEGPLVVIENAFLDRRSEELLASAFPARITVTVELWEGRTFFDRLVDTRSWQRAVRYEVLSRTYRVARIEADTIVEEGSFPTLDGVRAWAARPQRAPLTPPAGRRGLYYSVSVTIETLNSDDLAEVERWLKGEVGPAISGSGNAGSAVVRTFRTLLTVLLGGDTKRVSRTTAKFDS
jgi:hypothetical protein